MGIPFHEMAHLYYKSPTEGRGTLETKGAYFHPHHKSLRNITKKFMTIFAI